MKLSILSASLVFSSALSKKSCPFNTWKAPGPGDVRGPCPMMNSLTNHGFLPHNGRGLSEDNVVYALEAALNVAPVVSRSLFARALTSNPNYPNVSTFDLPHLGRHNILEHDASISRTDAYWGDPNTFNYTVFNKTRSYWKTPNIDIQQAADSRLVHVITSNTTNPTFELSEVGRDLGLGEVAAYLLTFQDRVNGEYGTAVKAWVEFFFENERLPLHLGWRRPNTVFQMNDITDMYTRVVNATGVTPSQLSRLLKARQHHYH